MRAASAMAGVAANRAPLGAGTPTTRNGYIAAAVRRIFHEDTVKTFARFTGLSVGAANKKVHGQRTIDADEMARLLRTDDGFEFLTALMADAQPKWWVLCSAFMEVREAQRLQAEARLRIRRAVRGALNADADLTAAISRADALSDADFHRPHADALRSMAGVPDRAVAAAAKGRAR